MFHNYDFVRPPPPLEGIKPPMIKEYTRRGKNVFTEETDS